MFRKYEQEVNAETTLQDISFCDVCLLSLTEIMPLQEM